MTTYVLAASFSEAKQWAYHQPSWLQFSWVDLRTLGTLPRGSHVKAVGDWGRFMLRADREEIAAIVRARDIRLEPTDF